MIDRLRSLARLAVCCLPLALMACGDDSSGPAAVKHLYFSQDSNGNGLFEIDLTTGAATLVGTGTTGTTAGTVGLTETPDPGVLIGSIWSDIARIAADGSGATVLAGSVGVEALAMNITTGILYGCLNGTCSTIHPVTGLSTGAITTPGTDIEGLAANASSGILYGLSRSTDSLYVYDIAGNSWSTIGSTTRSWLNTGLAYDHLANVLYAIDSNADSLFRINPATAAVTGVGPLGTNGAGGLAFVAQ